MHRSFHQGIDRYLTDVAQSPNIIKTTPG